MRLLVPFLALLISHGALSASPKAFFQSTFVLPASTGSVQEMQVALRIENANTIAKVRAKLVTGKIEEGEFTCTSTKESEYDCNRSDDGGGFVIITKPSVKIRFTYFDLADEGDAQDIPVLSPDSNKPIEIPGIKTKFN